MAKLFANNTSLCFDFVRFVLLLARGKEEDAMIYSSCVGELPCLVTHSSAEICYGPLG